MVGILSACVVSDASRWIAAVLIVCEWSSLQYVYTCCISIIATVLISLLLHVFVCVCLCVCVFVWVCVCLEWSEHDVVEKYLRPISMEHLAKVFTENKINGAVLMALEVSMFVFVFVCVCK